MHVGPGGTVGHACRAGGSMQWGMHVGPEEAVGHACRAGGSSGTCM